MEIHFHHFFGSHTKIQLKNTHYFYIRISDYSQIIDSNYLNRILSFPRYISFSKPPNREFGGGKETTGGGFNSIVRTLANPLENV